MKKPAETLPNDQGLVRREFVLLGVGALALAASNRSGAASNTDLPPTPRQIEGPFFRNRQQAELDADLTQVAGRSGRARGEVIVVSGRVTSTSGKPLAGVLIDVWQANAAGRYAHEADQNRAPLDDHFQGWAQLVTDRKGFYRFKTIKPGPYPVSDGWSRPPHIHFKLAKAGYRPLTTQMYFAGHPLNDKDGLLLRHSRAAQAKLLVEFRDHVTTAGESEIKAGEFNIVLAAMG